MSVWSFLFLLIAVVLGLFGFAGVVPNSAFLVKALFFIFMIFFIVAAIGQVDTPE